MTSDFRPIVIGIAGSSASGKTTIANFISEEIKRVTDGSINPTVISQDWFYKTVPKEAGDTYDWDTPTAMDIPELRRIIRELTGYTDTDGSLLLPGDTMAPRHIYSEYRSVPNSIILKTSPIIIVEGIFALYDNKDSNVNSILDMLDLAIYVDCDLDVCLTRRVMRDLSERGYNIELILQRWHVFSKKAQIDKIQPTRKNADIVVVNNSTYDDERPIEDNKMIRMTIREILNMLDDRMHGAS